MVQRRPGSPSVGRGGGLALRRALIVLAALPMCIALYRLCSGGSMGGGSAGRGSGLSRRRLGGDVLEVPHPLEERVRVAASLAAHSAAEHSADTMLDQQDAEPAQPVHTADAQPAAQQAGTAPSTAVVAGAAAVHGFVRKAGPLNPKLWQPQYRQWRRERRQAWLEDRQERLAAGGCGRFYLACGSIRMLVQFAICMLLLRDMPAHYHRPVQLVQTTLFAAGKPAPPLPLTQECQVRCLAAAGGHVWAGTKCTTGTL